eukprot:snap_masked-scaffold_44-processed-gene-1.59-mRNA-1 protein AED:1.00 eAED:1.00 QI:0/0/0/0/1/1/2/0/180
MGTFLCNAKEGTKIDILMKPAKLFEGKRYFLNRWKYLCLVCCGSGLAPLLQLIKFVFSDEADKTKIFLIYQNRNEEDILCLEELNNLKEKYPDQFHIHFILSKPTGKNNLEFEKGRFSSTSLDKELLEHLKKYEVDKNDVGTRSFVNTVGGISAFRKLFSTELKGILGEKGFTKKQVFKL